MINQGFCVWLTGIPSAGKTTIANTLQKHILATHGLGCSILDGDEVRANITKGLGFSPEDRLENMSRVAWMAGKIVAAGGIAIVAMVSPMEDARQIAYNIIGKDKVVVCHVDASKEVAIKRDVKGLYAKAISGQLTGLTGFDAPYELPINPDCYINTSICTPDIACSIVHKRLQDIGHLPDGQYALFIGRWSPFHNGHKYIIDKMVASGKNVAIGVRNSQDAYNVDERINMIQAVYPNAWVFPMADISSVNIGRLVGYDVNRFEVPEDIHGISATAIRKKMSESDDSWRENVPAEVQKYMDENNV